MSKRKLSNDDALAPVLSDLKGEIPVSDLCRKFGVSTATYYKLRDRFIAAGTQGLQNRGKTNQFKALELRINELEAITSIEAYIDFYNNDRIHSALGYMTPAEYYQQSILQSAA